MSFLRRLFLVFFFIAFTVTPLRAETNIRVGAISALVGMLDVQADFGVSSAWTLGPTLQYLDRTIDGYKVSALGIGIRGNYYFNENVFTQGWYLGPSLSYLKATVSYDSDYFGDLEGSASGLAATLLAGYQWMWESFNINLGAGPVYYTIGEVEVKSDDGEEDKEYTGYDRLGLALEFTLGWKF